MTNNDNNDQAPPSYEEIFGKAEIPEGTNQQGLPGYSTQTHVAAENEQQAPRLIGRYLIRTNRNIELESNHPNVCVRPVRVNRCRLQRVSRRGSNTRTLPITQRLAARRKFLSVAVVVGVVILIVSLMKANGAL